MKAFDTDILTQILRGNPAFSERVASVPVAEQAIPIVAAEEVLRGRLNGIRQAEAGKAKITIEQAYQFFEQTLKDIRELTVLSYTPQAEVQAPRMCSRSVSQSDHGCRYEGPHIRKKASRRGGRGVMCLKKG